MADDPFTTLSVTRRNVRIQDLLLNLLGSAGMVLPAALFAHGTATLCEDDSA